MQRITWRQAAVVGLAVLLGLASPGAWTYAKNGIVQTQLNSAVRWLKGSVIVIDPGHGGDDPGAVVNGTEEKQVVLEIALQLKSVLEAEGATVVLTRDADEDLGGKIREELGKRVALAERHKARAYVSIHANKDTCYCWGAQTFYQKDGGHPEGKALALAIQDQLRRNTPTTRVALAANYFVLRTNVAPAAMVEVGFLTNAKEHAKLKDSEYQQTLAKAVALGIADFFRSQVPDARAEGSIGQ